MGYVLLSSILEPHLKSPRISPYFLPLPLADNNDNAGLITAYGAYAHYHKNSLLPNSTATDIAWPGTLQAVLIIAVGVISGTFFDRGIYSHSSALRREFFSLFLV